MRPINVHSMQTMSMPTKVATLVFGFILLIPIVTLLIVAGIVAFMVFGVLLIIGIINTKLRSLTGRDREGRHNVRVRR